MYNEHLEFIPEIDSIRDSGLGFARERDSSSKNKEFFKTYVVTLINKVIK